MKNVKENKEVSFLNDLYAELISQVAKDYKKDERLCTLYPIKGKLYNQHEDNCLMVIGRAVNGWKEGTYWTTRKLKQLDDQQYYLDKLSAFHYPEDGECPLGWVKKRWMKKVKGNYSTKRSAFWRVINKTITQLEPHLKIEQEWPSKIIWSNLYKIAPVDNKNPNTKLQRVQRDNCIKIIREEILTWQPKRILFLTGFDWAKHFIEGIDEIEIKSTDELELIDGIGTIKFKDYIGKIAIAKHPQGKKESKMNEELKKVFI